MVLFLSTAGGVFGLDNDGGGEGVILRANTDQNALKDDTACHGPLSPFWAKCPCLVITKGITVEPG